MNSRRSSLANLEITKLSATNPNTGLWLDKYIKEQDRGNTDSRRQFVSDVAALRIPEAYNIFYQRWEEYLEDFKASTRIAKAKGRMIIGLGDENVIETSVTLHRTYGVPYIPGSALKGLTASYARQRLDESWQIGSEAYKIVFGDTDNAGYITFFDALYIPGTGFNNHVLYPDVITVHHQKYYQGTNSAPADWDDPVPVPFLSATGSYLIALAAPGLTDAKTWLDTTFDIIKFALLEMGIGAKTSSGYGRMELEVPPKHPDILKVESYKKSIEVMPNKDVANQIPNYYQKWKTLVLPIARKMMAEAIIQKVHETQREKQSQEKPWYQDLLKYLVNPDE
jgi:CRISPR-associated protein Cmr6